MKKLALLLLLITSTTFSTYAQGSAKAAQTPELRVTLAGVTESTIRIQQIKEQPMVHIAQKQISAFDIAWTIRTESGGSEYEGPFHNTGNKLSTATLNDLVKCAAKGTVTRIYIDGVYLLTSEGTPTKTIWGAAYKVVN